MEKSDNTQEQAADANQHQAVQPASVTVQQPANMQQQQQQVRLVNPIPARRMMWPGARPRFIGARPVAPVVNQQPVDPANGYQVPVAPVPFCPYPVPPFAAQQAVNASSQPATVDSTIDGQGTDQEKKAEQKVTGPSQRGRGRGRPRGAMGRPHPVSHNTDAGDAAAVQHAMAAYWLIWSWLTQLHNTYDLNITLSVKPTAKDDSEQASGDAEKDQGNAAEDTTEPSPTKDAEHTAEITEQSI